MLYFPEETETANHGVFTTAMMALMVAWILQKTRTIPGCDRLRVTAPVGACGE